MFSHEKCCQCLFHVKPQFFLCLCVCVCATEMMQSLAQRPAPANTNRERRPRYQHPKGAPNADLIFKTGGRWDVRPDHCYVDAQKQSVGLGHIILLCTDLASLVSLWTERKEQGMKGMRSETDKRDKTGKTSRRETKDMSQSRLEQLELLLTNCVSPGSIEDLI